MINRAALILKYKAPAIKWVNGKRQIKPTFPN